MNMDQKREQQDQLKAFQSKNRDMVMRLGKVVTRTQDRMNEFKDLATQSVVEATTPSAQGNYSVQEE